MYKLLILITFFISSTYADDIKKSIDSSIAYIEINTYDMNTNKKDSGKMKGSGLIIEYKEQQYLITNAHVCVGNYLRDLYLYQNTDKVKYQEVINNAGIDYSIKIGQKDMMLSTDLTQIKFNLSQDVCAINLGKKYIKNAYKIKDDIISLDKENKARFYTYNHSPNKFMIKKGKLQYVLKEQEMTSQLMTDKEAIITLKMSEQAAYSFKAVPGDSGSPVFNPKNELIGLVCSTVIGMKATYIITKNEIINVLSKQ